ncbi:MAG TPA: hypothetical protein VJT85_05125 [Gemmatimonadaceae bacterium]|nr:hypothetical protein [Gemmatimonadaceae bacterium]
MRVWSTVLMSLAALATSWASYQASLWSGTQFQHGANAGALRAKSTRAAGRAGELRMIDIGTFAHWMTARAGGDSVLADFIAARFRHEFKPAFDGWVASRPMHSRAAAPTPFVLPSYRLADEAVADSLDRAAERESAASQRANRISDTYVLDAVIMATVLFFAGTDAGALHRFRILNLLIATGMLVTGIIRLLGAPRA